LEQGAIQGSDPDSPFELSVANALRALGHNVELQVGVSGYKIDLAVRHPDKPAHFVIGIECDGACYHGAKSARDRDRLRQEALERLGWRLTRVWSTDWFHDQPGQTERLDAEIRAALQAEAFEGRPARLVDMPTIGVADEEMPPHHEVPQPSSDIDDDKARSTERSEEAAETDVIALAEALRRFRDETIMRELPGSDRSRGILREPMIEAIVRSELDDPADFLMKIPQNLREATDGRQMQYLHRICEIVSEFAT
jgi:very-short-patch-repair endonuclease